MFLHTMKLDRLIALAVFLTTCSAASAQWRAGFTAGAAENTLCLDTQYQYDWRYDDRRGVNIGLMGQYDFSDWLALRAELLFQQRGYTMRRTETYAEENLLRYRDNYLVLPVMASFSFGGNALRGFLNAGVAGGYWLESRCKGALQDAGDEKEELNVKIEFLDKRDCRFDFGYVGGLGLEYRICTFLAAQVEARYYYSVVSKKKQYQAAKDYQYNSTLTLSAGVAYIF